ncbi:hypothetical protein K491DRAFT_608304, partial [Lophiostoma macrostomum CBS 122681]
GGSKASVIISLVDCVVANDALRQDSISVTNKQPVGWFIDYLATKGRFRYAFTSEGVGCRQWVTDTLKLLADEGEISSAESDSARHALAHTWPGGCAAGPAVGTYF